MVRDAWVFLFFFSASFLHNCFATIRKITRIQNFVVFQAVFYKVKTPRLRGKDLDRKYDFVGKKWVSYTISVFQLGLTVHSCAH